MNKAPESPSSRGPVWSDAVAAAAVLAVDPTGIGGVLVRARPGPARDAWLERLAELLPAGTRSKRMPLHIDDARLLGGLDLAATLQAGRPVAQRGLLAEADGGVLIVAMAERLSGSAAAQLAVTLDTREVALQRDGLSQCHAARFGIVALDEGDGDDEHAPAALADRLALQVDLTGVGWRSTLGALDAWDRDAVQAARARLPRVVASDEVVEALCAAAWTLGVYSLRAPCLAVHVARIAAALGGRDEVNTEDAAQAARWVLGPRATRLPPPEPPAEDAQQPEDAPGQQTEEQSADKPADPKPDPTPERQSDAERDTPPEPPPTSGAPLEDVVLDAAQAAIPAGLLERLIALGRASSATPTSGRAGAVQFSRLRGRPLGARRGEPRSGARLDLIATLRTAAPWQALRRRERGATGTPSTRIEVRRDDFHVARYQQRRATTTVFVVDASGSAALHRLAEAKGAVELLLADCYVRRDSVAVIAFRGAAAEVLLPPTRSLVRAKRSLAGLPGGGGTPLAAGIDAAAQVAEAIRRRGDTPVLVLLTDGRGNVARDGTPGRARAGSDALAAAQRLSALGVAVLLLDTSPQPQPQGQALAAAMGARYMPLPYAGAAAVSAAAAAVGASAKARTR